MNLLFWNLGRNDNADMILSCFQEHDIDIAVFSEYTSCSLSKVAQQTQGLYIHIKGIGGCEKINAFIKTSVCCESVYEQSRYVIYCLVKQTTRFVLAGVHLQDRRNCNSAMRIETIGRLVNDIDECEQHNKCNNTIIIGDFNANPFDPELLQFNAFNSVLFKDVIKNSETRIVDRESYRRFYNPVINYLSEETRMYGSYYDTRDEASPVWHCLDQVLLSNSLVESVLSMQYLKTIGNQSLLKDIRPNKSISDHLPLLVVLKETEG